MFYFWPMRLICRRVQQCQMRISLAKLAGYIFAFTLVVLASIFALSLYHRTTNMWALKNLGDSFLTKRYSRRLIVVGAFHRLRSEQNVDGDFAVIQFVGDTRQNHELYCHSEDVTGRQRISQAHVVRIHQGKRAATDVCAWSGHIAECQIASSNVDFVSLTTDPHLRTPTGITVAIEKPVRFKHRHKLVVCVAPMYIYTEWQILVTGIESWLALGATKIIFPIQSTSNDTYRILKAYEKQGIVILRDWPKWPVLSDTNPNGLVLSRGIEESHVNCLHFAKPFAEMIVFTDIDDMLLPADPLKIYPTANIDILENLFKEHPQAGTLLFEHRDVQFVLPESKSTNSLQNFNFDFLHNTKWKQNCKVWRMKTRVVVNASRVDTVNMHESGIHRLGYVQVRVPCRQAHFYHLRHSYKNAGINEWGVDMNLMALTLNKQWQERLQGTLSRIANRTITKSSLESFEDFDQCVMEINAEHWSLKVSRCMTPHVCYSRLARNLDCISTLGDYEFAHSRGDFIIVLRRSRLVTNEPNCEAPLPKYINGNYFYLP